MLSIAQALFVGIVAVIPGFAWRLCSPNWFTGRNNMAPLLGMCTLAWWIQVVYLFGGSASLSVSTAIVAWVAVVIACRREVLGALAEYKTAAVQFALYYLFCIAIASMLAWPAVGPWSTDWVVNFEQSEAIWQSAPLKGWLLARPAMYAALAVPYLFAIESLPAYQLSCCAACAASLVSITWYLQKLNSRQTPWLIFGLLCCSPFFLVNFTSFVPKFVQGTLIVGVFLLMKGSRHEHLAARMALSTILICFAMELHHSTVAYVFAFLVGWIIVGRRLPIPLATGGLIAVVLALFLVVAPESRKIWLYGLDEIKRFNPSASVRSDEPAWRLFLLTLECKFLGYDFLVPPYIFAKELLLGTPRPLSAYFNWYWFVHLGTTANTIVFIMLPMLFNLKRLQEFWKFASGAVPTWVPIAMCSAIFVNTILNPYHIGSGNVHCGSTAIALGLILLAIAWLSNAPHYGRNSLLFSLIYGFAPWLIWQAVQSTLVQAAGGFKDSGAVFDDNLDIGYVLGIGQAPWGHGAWPWLPLFLSAAFAVVFIAVNRPSSVNLVPDAAQGVS